MCTCRFSHSTFRPYTFSYFSFDVEYPSPPQQKLLPTEFPDTHTNTAERASFAHAYSTCGMLVAVVSLSPCGVSAGRTAR